MNAAEKVADWSFQLVGLGLVGVVALVAVIIVAVQVWLIAYYNPWGIVLFPLRETVLTLISGIIVCFAVSFIGMLWNSAP